MDKFSYKYVTDNQEFISKNLEPTLESKINSLSDIQNLLAKRNDLEIIKRIGFDLNPISLNEDKNIKRPSITKAVEENTIYCGFRWQLVERNLEPNIIHSLQPTKETKVQEQTIAPHRLHGIAFVQSSRAASQDHLVFTTVIIKYSEPASEKTT